MTVIQDYKDEVKKIYRVSKYKRWYETHPYTFQFTSRKYQGGSSSLNVPGKILFNLPITPQNINTTTHFATNVITTLYGVVEEHSEVRYWDIAIQGTTGYVPQYYNPVEWDQDEGNNFELESDELGDISTPYATDGRKTHDPFNSIIPDGVTEALDTFGVASGIVGAIDQITADILTAQAGGQINSKAGMKLKATGYTAFHNFYRFLLHYKRDAAGHGKAGFKTTKIHPLLFINYKDNVKYDCVPTNFTLVRSADDPMVYNYSISLKCFNMRQVTGNQNSTSGLSAFYASVGLGGGSGSNGGGSDLDDLSSALDSIIDLVSTLTDLI